jgi:transcriptional regulator with XRE-family HTH domain
MMSMAHQKIIEERKKKFGEGHGAKGEMAKLLGLSSSGYTGIEKVKTQVNAENRTKIAQKLGFDPSEFDKPYRNKLFENHTANRRVDPNKTKNSPLEKISTENCNPSEELMEVKDKDCLITAMACRIESLTQKIEKLEHENERLVKKNG